MEPEAQSLSTFPLYHRKKPRQEEKNGRKAKNSDLYISVMRFACFDCSGAAGVMNCSCVCVCMTCLAEINGNDLQLLK